MLVKSQVKYIQSLGHKKFRDATGVFVAEGPKIVSELMQSDNLRLVQCFATEDWLSSHEDMQNGREKLFIRTNEKELGRISFHPAPNQVLAIFSKPVFNKIKTSEGLTLLLDNIQNPGNFGTILRTADWFGVHRLVCSQDTVDVFNPKVVQSAMGSVARVEISYTNLEEYIRLNPGIPLYSSSLQGEDLRDKLVLSNAMLLVGNESEGVSPSLESLAIKKIRIPGRGAAESLNVAVATGIILSRIEWIS